MKTKIFLIVFLLLLLKLEAATPLTPFFQNFYNADGSAQTNVITMTAYPAVNSWTVVGTNVVFGAANIIMTPDTNGYVTNAVSPNQYRLQFAGLNYSLYVNIPNTTNVMPLGMYVINAPVIAGAPLSGYALITNLLGYAPPLPTPAGITGALGYVPPTNSYSALTNVLGFIPATNGGPLVYAQLPWIPPTNTYSGLTSALGFAPATNPPILLTTNLAVLTPGSQTNFVNITNGTVQSITHQ
ncbi:MAG TPA: hypothetical protein VG347_15145 [Verrucomicrobiae bacterium]|nr:hypothetical protein [Verrucomicrobiae bacterium]